MFFWENALRKLTDLIKHNNDLTDEEYIIKEINSFKSSKRRKLMIDGEKYFVGDHDILHRKRTAIGVDGKLEEVTNLPNNKIVDNQYKKMVNQKNNYLLGKPIAIKSDNKIYADLLNDIFNKSFLKLFKNIGEDSLNCGIGWMFIYYDDEGKLAFKRFKPFECIPLWHDAEHTKLDALIRIYEIIHVTKTTEKIIEKVEIYDTNGIRYYTLDGSKLIPDEIPFENYFTITSGEEKQGYNWSKIPLIPFKYNNKEIPLIKMIKSLQDGLNLIESNFQNNMEEDVRNTILVLVNYDGENLADFRKNLAQYGAVKLKTVDGTGGDLRTLQIEVNSENYKSIIELFKKAIIENAMGYDAKDDRMSGNPNQMNIQSMYSDIDLDANGTETEYQASFEELLWFINCHLYNVGLGDFENEDVQIIFNRDILINEGEVINNCQKSLGTISDETVVANHPWVDDPQKEIERLEAQKRKELELYPFPTNEPPKKSFNNEGGDLNGEEE